MIKSIKQLESLDLFEHQEKRFKHDKTIATYLLAQVLYEEIISRNKNVSRAAFISYIFVTDKVSGWSWSGGLMTIHCISSNCSICPFFERMKERQNYATPIANVKKIF